MSKVSICLGFVRHGVKNVNQFDTFVSGFETFSVIRKKSFKKGRPSGGVTVFVNYNLVEKGLVKQILHNFEECIVLSLDGQLLGIQRDLIICFLFISPERSTIYNEETGFNGVEIFDSKLYQIVQKYPDADIFLAGDFNARCGVNQDILFNDGVDFVFQDEDMYKSDFFELPRRSKDLYQNIFGLSLIELCKAYGIHILNGRSPGDNEGEITCIANDGYTV